VGGAILATGVLIVGLTGAARAEPTRASETLAASPAEAAAVAAFWLDGHGDALKKATEFRLDVTSKLTEGAAHQPGEKAGLEQPTGYKSVAQAEVNNVNLPATIGKVFFTTDKGELKWCSATSIDSQHRNLVATAAHCVYDMATDDVLDNWIFIPGYYQGEAPSGLYVGKTAHTHNDFHVYEDFDRDYAFVTVYNGFTPGVDKPVAKSVYEAHEGAKYTMDKEIGEKEYLAGIDKYGESGPYQKTSLDPTVETVAKPRGVTRQNIRDYLGDGVDGVKLSSTEVTESVYDAAPGGPRTGDWDNNAKAWWRSGTTAISQEEYNALSAAKSDGRFPGELTATKGGGGDVAWFKQQFYLSKWVRTSAKETYVIRTYIVQVMADKGRLGDNVGGQGFAWNQKVGQSSFAFGYPSAPHADGDAAWTGVTPKWCYNPKPSDRVYTAPAYKAEEHISIKCAMTGGADGGPWLIRYNDAKRVGYVSGVTSLFGDQDGNGRIDTITSAYFDGETETIYRAAAEQSSGSIVGKDGAFIR
jgi:hypothetical protein